MLSVANGHLEVVRLLLGTLHNKADYAAVLGTVNSQEQTALHRAVEQGHLAVLECLLACPCADRALGWRDKSGRTAHDLAKHLRDIPMALTLAGEPWSVREHSDYPFEFKVAVRCVLHMAQVDDRDGKKVPRHPDRSRAKYGFWSLPSGVLHKIFSFMAFPLSAWKAESKAAAPCGLSDSPADIIAANMQSGSCDHPAVDARNLERRASVRCFRPGHAHFIDPMGSGDPSWHARCPTTAAGSPFEDTASPADIIWDNTLLAHHRRPD
mmetsp:Transcript_4477/g.12527  ORF Transcript_4477/g.12527 Transcript_4477/m.12527 type:complete len:267 (-) Transcript_4477:126-926(-)